MLEDKFILEYGQDSNEILNVSTGIWKKKAVVTCPLVGWGVPSGKECKEVHVD